MVSHYASPDLAGQLHCVRYPDSASPSIYVLIPFCVRAAEALRDVERGGITAGRQIRSAARDDVDVISVGHQAHRIAVIAAIGIDVDALKNRNVPFAFSTAAL